MKLFNDNSKYVKATKEPKYEGIVPTTIHNWLAECPMYPMSIPVILLDCNAKWFRLTKPVILDGMRPY